MKGYSKRSSGGTAWFECLLTCKTNSDCVMKMNDIAVSYVSLVIPKCNSIKYNISQISYHKIHFVLNDFCYK